MRTRQIPDEKVAVLAIEGEIDLAWSPELREILQSYVKAECPVLILDFKDVSYLDSSALATLIEYVREAQRFGGKMVIAQPNERVRTIFEIVRLDEFLAVYPTMGEARAAALAPTKV